MVALLGNLRQLREVLQCLLRILHLEEEKAAFHQTLADCFGVDLDCLGEGEQCSIVVANPFEGVTLAEIAEAVLRLERNYCTEVTQCFLPFFLEDVDLAASDVCLNISVVLHEGFAQSSECPCVVIDSTVSD